MRSDSTTSELELEVDPISNSADEIICSDIGSEDNISMGDELSWPEAKWQCFISGTVTLGIAST